MPRIPPGFHIDELPGSISTIVYEHPAAAVARAMPGWYRFNDKVQPFREVLVEWAPDPDAEARASRPQSALLCGGFVEQDEVAPYVGTLDCTFFSYQHGTDWSLLRVVRGGQVAHELYWGPDPTPSFEEAGLAPPPLDPGEIAVVVGGDQVRYKGALTEQVSRLATEVATSRELVDRLCRELGICVPNPVHFPDVDYDPEPGDDRDLQIPEDVVECWLR